MIDLVFLFVILLGAYMSLLASILELEFWDFDMERIPGGTIINHQNFVMVSVVQCQPYQSPLIWAQLYSADSFGLLH